MSEIGCVIDIVLILLFIDTFIHEFKLNKKTAIIWLMISFIGAIIIVAILKAIGIWR